LEREDLAEDTLRAEGPHELVHGLVRTAHHRLARRVVVREDDSGVRPLVGERRQHALGRGPDRPEGEAGDRHRVGVERLHEVADLVRRVHPGGRHRGPLADTVPGDRVRDDAHLAQRGVQQPSDADHIEAVAANIAYLCGG
jgi:hypothetical protein